MDYLEFGRMLRALRQQKFSYTPEGNLKPWTQQRLADETQVNAGNKEARLTVKQIADLEQGRVVNIRPEVHLEPLARALGLGEIQKIEFYAAAGFIYSPPKQLPHKLDIGQLLNQANYPASIRTPLWDFVAFNSYHYALWNYSQETLAALAEDDLGANLLRILFDPLFNNKQYCGGDENWQIATMRNLLAFRSTSFRYVATPRYRQIINEMAKKYKEFEKLWVLSEILLDKQGYFSIPSVTTIHHPQFGEMSFMSVRMPEEYLNKEIYVSWYIPLVKSEATYRQFSERIKTGKLFFFRELPI